MTPMSVHEVTERLGIPDQVEWGDPITLTYGECTVEWPRRGPTRMAVSAPSLDAIIALLHDHEPA